MFKVIEHNFNGKKYFEFDECDYWEDIETIATILVNQKGALLVDKIDGIYSRYWTFEIANLIFMLIYHEDLGTCLCLPEPDENKYKHLFKLANEMLPLINMSSLSI